MLDVRQIQQDRMSRLEQAIQNLFFVTVKNSISNDLLSTPNNFPRIIFALIQKFSQDNHLSIRVELKIVFLTMFLLYYTMPVMSNRKSQLFYCFLDANYCVIFLFLG